MKIKTALLVLGVLFVSGCMSSKSFELRKLEIETVHAVNEKHAETPWIYVTCPEEGCNFRSFAVNNPNPQIMNIPRHTNVNDVIVNLTNLASVLAPWAAVTHIATTGIRNTGDRNNGSFNSTSNSDSSSVVADSNNSATTNTTSTSNSTSNQTTNTNSNNSTETVSTSTTSTSTTTNSNSASGDSSAINP